MIPPTLRKCSSDCVRAHSAYTAAAASMPRVRSKGSSNIALLNTTLARIVRVLRSLLISARNAFLDSTFFATEFGLSNLPSQGGSPRKAGNYQSQREIGD